MFLLLPSFSLFSDGPAEPGMAPPTFPFQAAHPAPLERSKTVSNSDAAFRFLEIAPLEGECYGDGDDRMETTGQILRLGLRNRASSFFSPVGQVLTVGSPRRREGGCLSPSRLDADMMLVSILLRVISGGTMGMEDFPRRATSSNSKSSPWFVSFSSNQKRGVNPSRRVRKVADGMTCRPVNEWPDTFSAAPGSPTTSHTDRYRVGTENGSAHPISPPWCHGHDTSHTHIYQNYTLRATPPTLAHRLMLRKILTPTGEGARTPQDLAAAAELRAEYDHCQSLVEILRFWLGGVFLLLLRSVSASRSETDCGGMTCLFVSSHRSHHGAALATPVDPGGRTRLTPAAVGSISRSQIQDRCILRGISPVG